MPQRTANLGAAVERHYAGFPILGRFLHINLAPAGWRDDARDDLARVGRLELQAILAGLPFVRCALVTDYALRRLGLRVSRAISADDRAEHGGAAGRKRNLPQDRATRKRCRLDIECFVHRVLHRWGYQHPRSQRGRWRTDSAKRESGGHDA